MDAVRPELDPAAAVAYCREARRLRHRLKHAPARLHRSLGELRPARGAAKQITETPNDLFAASVATAIERSTLRYSRRLALLKEAQHLGIERFEANLIIAMVQHRLGQLDIPEQPSRSRVPAWLIVTAVQVVIIGTALILWRLT